MKDVGKVCEVITQNINKLSNTNIKWNEKTYITFFG